LNNPNLLAHALLVGLPFCAYLATNRPQSRWRRAIAVLCMIPILYVMAKTGSRGALVGLMFALVVYSARAPLQQKVALMLGTVATFTIAVVLMPDMLRRRYLTFFETQEAPDQASELQRQMEGRLQDKAVASTHGRMHLVRESIRLTPLHPLFGVGPGQFALAQDALARSDGLHKGDWLVTHNTLAEFSSENGVPALFFFLAALVSSFQAARLPKLPRDREPPNWAEIRNARSATA
jgi:O-antigen ligase